MSQGQHIIRHSSDAAELANDSNLYPRVGLTPIASRALATPPTKTTYPKAVYHPQADYDQRRMDRGVGEAKLPRPN